MRLMINSFHSRLLHGPFMDYEEHLSTPSALVVPTPTRFLTMLVTTSAITTLAADIVV